MTNEERQQAIEWLKRRPVMMAGAKRMYDLAVEALEAYVPDTNVGDMISRRAALDAISCDITVTGRQNAELVAATIGTFADRIKALPPVQLNHNAEVSIMVDDLISRQAAIDALDCINGVEEVLRSLPSAHPDVSKTEQADGWMERNKDRILQAGLEGREVEFRIGGRLFAIREKAQ